MKPLEVDSGPSQKPTEASSSGSRATGPDKDLSMYKDEWGEFLHKPANNIKDQKKAEKLRDKLQQRKEKRQLEERLARIRTLGESDDEIDDVSKWVNRNKRVTDMRLKKKKRVSLIF